MKLHTSNALLQVTPKPAHGGITKNNRYQSSGFQAYRKPSEFLIELITIFIT